MPLLVNMEPSSKLAVLRRVSFLQQDKFATEFHGESERIPKVELACQMTLALTRATKPSTVPGLEIKHLT
jgi:hypothetical protein